eukprot:TRINITY_DN14864_c0_g1_i1.p1 TRINITY_DN14864_c0_g1~~TRINITY_DN14864_c0_g1_i1.p1  ORF type:complete len:400 (+),score=52.26 TRINITY_DN14864_c0_g1_i1:59-1201(+)
MAPSPPQQENEDEEKPNTSSLCDYCGETRALLYCRADSAKLCCACDRQVHSTNALFSKHSRSQLCDACATTPASIRCFTHSLVLCQNCDWESHCHDLPSSPHDRRPVEGFSGCPSAVELYSILGFLDDDGKSLLVVDDSRRFDDGSMTVVVDGFEDSWVWETPTIGSFDDLIFKSGSQHNFQALGVSPMPKHRNIACGKHKEEILQQLRKLIKFEDFSNNDAGEFESSHGFKSMAPEQKFQMGHLATKFEHDATPIIVPDCEASAPQWRSDCHEATDQVPFPYLHSGSSMDQSLLVPVGPIDVHDSGSHGRGDNKEHLVPVEHAVLTGHDRDSMILRYKEKKKTRRYDKHVRYESRKVRADSRTRIKGRFAKVNQDQNLG